MRLKISDKISIEPLRDGHAEELFALTDANRAYLREWLPWLDSAACLADTAASIATRMIQAKNGEGQTLSFYSTIPYAESLASINSASHTKLAHWDTGWQRNIADKVS